MTGPDRWRVPPLRLPCAQALKGPIAARLGSDILLLTEATLVDVPAAKVEAPSPEM